MPGQEFENHSGRIYCAAGWALQRDAFDSEMIPRFSEC